MTENDKKVIFSSKKNDWETPKELYDKLNSIFGFNIDLCADIINAKHSNFISENQNYIETKIENMVGWLNPPYSKKTKSSYGQEDFVKKAVLDSENNTIICCLLPVRTDTKLWQKIIFPNANAILFLKKRLRFVNAVSSAPFPSAIIIFGRIKRTELEKLTKLELGTII